MSHSMHVSFAGICSVPFFSSSFLDLILSPFYRMLVFLTLFPDLGVTERSSRGPSTDRSMQKTKKKNHTCKEVFLVCHLRSSHGDGISTVSLILHLRSPPPSSLGSKPGSRGSINGPGSLVTNWAHAKSPGPIKGRGRGGGGGSRA